MRVVIYYFDPAEFKIMDAFDVADDWYIGDDLAYSQQSVFHLIDSDNRIKNGMLIYARISPDNQYIGQITSVSYDDRTGITEIKSDSFLNCLDKIVLAHKTADDVTEIENNLSVFSSETDFDGEDNDNYIEWLIYDGYDGMGGKTVDTGYEDNAPVNFKDYVKALTNLTGVRIEFTPDDELKHVYAKIVSNDVSVVEEFSLKARYISDYTYTRDGDTAYNTVYVIKNGAIYKKYYLNADKGTYSESRSDATKPIRMTSLSVDNNTTDSDISLKVSNIFNEAQAQYNITFRVNFDALGNDMVGGGRVSADRYFRGLKVGDFIYPCNVDGFEDKVKGTGYVYSKVTKLKYTDSYVEITCGLVRIGITEKLKILAENTL